MTIKKTRSKRVDTKVPESKEQKYKEQVRELRALNRKLTRENSRLKKELNQADQQVIEFEVQEAVTILEQEHRETLQEKKRNSCKKCKSEDTVVVPAGQREVVQCNECGSKSTRKAIKLT